MARIQWIEHRLQNWARWRLGASGSSLGYAAVNLADPTPEAGRRPYEDAPLPINDLEASETEKALQQLPVELGATVVEVYTGKGGEKDHLRVLGCSKSSMHARVDQAHRLLASYFTARHERQKTERARVEALQRLARAAVTNPGGFTP